MISGCHFLHNPGSTACTLNSKAPCKTYIVSCFNIAIYRYREILYIIGPALLVAVCPLRQPLNCLVYKSHVVPATSLQKYRKNNRKLYRPKKKKKTVSWSCTKDLNKAVIRLWLFAVCLVGVFHMCLFMCSARWSEREKARSHRWHWKGRWPVCLRK